MGTHPVHQALTTDYVQTLIRTKARQVSRYWEFRRCDPDDIEQDLIAYVLKQAHHFDPARASVKTFIDRVIGSAIAMMLRDRGRLKRAAGLRAISLDSTFVDRCRSDLPLALRDIVQEADLPSRRGTEVRDHRERIDLAADIAHAMEGLTAQQLEVVHRLVGASEAAVARGLGTSRRQVRKAVEAIRQRLQDAGLADFRTLADSRRAGGIRTPAHPDSAVRKDR